MGVCCGALTEVMELDETNHFLITTLRSYDSMFFLHAPPSVIRRTQEVMSPKWPITQTMRLGGCTKIKFRGNIWWASGEAKMSARKCLCQLIDAFWEMGWILQCCADLDRTAQDGSDLIFKLGTPKDDSAYEMACLSINRFDKIRIVSSKSDLASSTEKAIRTAWPKGIQNKSTAYKCPEFKLSGNPWGANGEDTVHCRRLIMHALKNAERVGYLPYGSIGLQKRGRSINSLYMKEVERKEPNPSKRFCISMNKCDRLRLISEVGAYVPENLKGAISDVIKRSWGRIQSTQGYAGSFEFKLKGNPWLPRGDDGIRSRILMAEILKVMMENGWDLIMSTDLSKKEADTSTLFFRKAPKRKNANVCVMTPVDSNRFRLLNGVPQVVKDSFIGICREVGLQVNGYNIKGGIEYRFRNHIWMTINQDNSCKGKSMIIRLFDEMTKAGWFFLDAIDTSKKMAGNNENRYPADTNALYFCHQLVMPIHQWGFSDDPPPPFCEDEGVMSPDYEEKSVLLFDENKEGL